MDDDEEVSCNRHIHSDGTQPAYNDGVNGLERLDFIVYKAGQVGIRLALKRGVLVDEQINSPYPVWERGIYFMVSRSMVVLTVPAYARQGFAHIQQGCHESRSRQSYK